MIFNLSPFKILICHLCSFALFGGFFFSLALASAVNFAQIGFPTQATSFVYLLFQGASNPKKQTSLTAEIAFVWHNSTFDGV